MRKSWECFLSIILSLIIVLVPLSAFAEDKVIPDDECVTKVFLKFADSLGKVSYREMKEHLDSLGYKYETKIGTDVLTTFDISCEFGYLYICFNPLGFNDSDYGNPEKEMLCCLEFFRDDRWITISDEMHISGVKLIT